MRVSFDTDELPAPRRVRAWRELMCDTYIGLECPKPSDDFRLVTDGHVVGDYSLTRGTSSGHHADRLATHIRKDGIERIYLAVMLAGTFRLTQGNREALIDSGMIAFTDTSRPYRTSSGPASDALWIGVPKQPLLERFRGLEDLTCVAFRPARPLHRTAFDLLAGLDGTLGPPLCPERSEERVAQAIDLLATTAILSALAPAEAASKHRARHRLN